MITSNLYKLRPLIQSLSGLSSRSSSIHAFSKLSLNNSLMDNSYSRGLFQKFPNPCSILKRDSTIFVSIPATQIWEGVTGPRGSSKKRARGKRRVTRPKIDLNKGQIIGVGKAGIKWPGLLAPIYHSNNMRNLETTDIDQAYIDRLYKYRNESAVKRKKLKLAPIERGWSGARMGGQSVGSPHKAYPEFDSRILELKVVATMTATKGRFRRFSALIATGNGEGIVGIGSAKSTSMRSAIKRARDRAFQNLMSYDLKENRTLYHMGHVTEWHTTIFAIPQTEGHGLVCHRLLNTLCRLIGIKDMYAKVEGNVRNSRMLVHGFMRLLREQKSYQEIANEYGLHVVEFTKDRDYYPHVLASPKSTNIIDKIQDSLSEGVKNMEITPTGQPVQPIQRSILTHPSQRPIMLQSKPEKHEKFKPPEDTSNFHDNLVDHVDNDAAEDLKTLLAEGERDLNTLLVLKGRVPRIKPNKAPFYWNLPGNIKVREERNRFRNQESAARERQAYKDLDKQFSSH